MKTLPALLLSLIAASTCNAELITSDSIYGADTITLDTDTFTEWLMPSRSIRAPDGHLRTYSDILTELSAGGLFEGWRYATRDEVETLLYSSAGFDPVTSQNSDTATQSDVVAAQYLVSHLSYTRGGSNGPNEFSSILDALFDDGLENNPGRTVISYGYQGSYTHGGGASFQNLDELETANNVAPYGHWLVRVPEPGTLTLLALGATGLIASRRRKT